MSENGSNVFEFTDPERVSNILAQYPDKRSATLPLLHLAQSQAGYITEGIIRKVAKIVDVHPSEIMDTVSFYSMFYQKKKGKYHLQFCQTLSCFLNGADELVDHVCKKLRIKTGETTTDGKFSVSKVECLGSCGTAPVVQVNLDYHENLNVKKVDDLINSL